MYTSWGRLRYDPRMPRQKVVEPNWLILDCDPAIGFYYSWLLFKHHCVKLRRPAWKCHVSVIRSEGISCPDKWGHDDGRKIKFEYDPVIKTNGRHYWLSVHSEELLDVRAFYGLDRKTWPPLHLTLGNDELKGGDQ